MKFDPQIVAQATEFVNNWRSGKGAVTHAMTFAEWPQFMAAVKQLMGAAA